MKKEVRKRPNEADLAWDLVDDHRGALTPAERDMAFVDLGVGDFTTVISSVLTAVQRSGEPLSAAHLEKVEAWIDFYARRNDFHLLVPGPEGEN